MTYDNFISQFEIYPTQKSAQKKGFEAHHIIPRAMQNTPDDRCVRLTPLQHIYAHYLLALENEDAAYIFYCMSNYSVHKLSELEAITIEQLEEWARLREEGRHIQIEKNIGENNPMYGTHLSEEEKKYLSELRKQWRWSEEVKQKISKSRMGFKPNSESVSKMALTKIGNTYNKGRHWYNNGTKQIMAYECPEGYVSGKLYGNSEERNKKASNSIRGLLYWNNGVVNKRSRECPGPEWKRGFIKKKEVA